MSINSRHYHLLLSFHFFFFFFNCFEKASLKKFLRNSKSATTAAPALTGRWVRSVCLRRCSQGVSRWYQHGACECVRRTTTRRTRLIRKPIHEKEMLLEHALAYECVRRTYCVCVSIVVSRTGPYSHLGL